MYLLAALFGFAVLWFGNPSMTRGGLGALGIPGFSTYDLPDTLGAGYMGRVLAETLAFVTPFDSHTTARYLLNGPLWSIYCEVFFYLLFPVLLWLLRRVGSAPALWAIAAVLWIVELGLILFVTQGQVGPAAEWSQIHAALYTNPIARLPEFMIGMSLALARQRSTWKPQARHLWIGVAIAVAVLVFSLQLGSRESMRPLGYYWLVVPANAVMIALLALLPKASGQLESRSVKLGLLSYAVYAIHWPVLVMAFVMQARLGLPVGVVLLVAAAVVFAGGWLIVRVYETPARAWLYARLHTRRARAVDPGSSPG